MITSHGTNVEGSRMAVPWPLIRHSTFIYDDRSKLFPHLSALELANSLLMDLVSL